MKSSVTADQAVIFVNSAYALYRALEVLPLVSVDTSSLKCKKKTMNRNIFCIILTLAYVIRDIESTVGRTCILVARKQYNGLYNKARIVIVVIAINIV